MAALSGSLNLSSMDSLVQISRCQILTMSLISTIVMMDMPRLGPRQLLESISQSYTQSNYLIFYKGLGIDEARPFYSCL